MALNFDFNGSADVSHPNNFEEGATLRTTSLNKLTPVDLRVLSTAMGVPPDIVEKGFVFEGLEKRETRYKLLQRPEIPGEVINYLYGANQGEQVSVSAELLFWALVRQSFLQAGIHDWPLTLYVTDVHSGFVAQALEKRYFLDSINFALKQEGSQGFTRYVDTGKYAIMMGGVFSGKARAVEDEIPMGGRHRDARDPSYYRHLGKSAFATAAQYRIADQAGLKTVFRRLVSRFEQITGSLEQMAQAYLDVGNRPDSVDSIIRTAERNIRETTSYGQESNNPGIN